MKPIQQLTSTGAACLALLLPGVAAAQVCNSTGADGAFTFNTPGVYDFDPVASNLNAAGDNVFNFTTITIGSGVRVRLRASKMKSQRPVVFLASGVVNIAGSLDLSGAQGHAATDPLSLRSPSEPGPGGYPGGAGGKPGDVAQVGSGPGGGAIGATTFAFGCPAAYAGQPQLGNSNQYAAAHCPIATTIYGNAALQPLVGGSGGSGGKAGTTFPGAGGGAGGGAIRICSDASITIPTQTGSVNGFYAIQSRGGDGGLGNWLSTGGGFDGGAGSGGSIHLQAPTVTLGTPNFNGILYAAGGNQNDNGGGGSYDVGSAGRIRIDANNIVTTSSVFPAPVVGTFTAVPLPNPPTVRITSINGVAVAANPKNNVAAPDVTINTTGSVPIVVQTANVPNGTSARFYVSTDPGGTDIVQTATVTSNTATLNVALPSGVNHIFVRATF
jgi:hypothetical protein